MKRDVVSAALAVCLAQPAGQAVAQTVSDQCFALGDIAVYSPEGQGMTPDQASMIATADCANQHKAQPSGQ
jgi:hypothetical protein